MKARLSAWLVAVLGALLLLRSAGDLPVVQVAAGGFYVAIGLSSLGGLLEGHPWAAGLEAARLTVLLVVATALLALSRPGLPLIAAISGFGLLSLAWLVPVRRALAPLKPT
ncbi:MAG: hypothetical protein AAB075_11475 [Gemmatimonadota bacterium]